MVEAARGPPHSATASSVAAGEGEGEGQMPRVLLACCSRWPLSARTMSLLGLGQQEERGVEEEEHQRLASFRLRVSKV